MLLFNKSEIGNLLKQILEDRQEKKSWKIIKEKRSFGEDAFSKQLGGFLCTLPILSGHLEAMDYLVFVRESRIWTARADRRIQKDGLMMFKQMEEHSKKSFCFNQHDTGTGSSKSRRKSNKQTLITKSLGFTRRCKSAQTDSASISAETTRASAALLTPDRRSLQCKNADSSTRLSIGNH